LLSIPRGCPGLIFTTYGSLCNAMSVYGDFLA